MKGASTSFSPSVSAGSSTVYPLSEAMVAAFTAEGFPGQITVDSIGSGAGFIPLIGTLAQVAEQAGAAM